MKSSPVHLIATGPFGVAVAERLAGTLAAATITRADPSGRFWSQMWPPASMHVLCAWRAMPWLASRLDEMSFAWGTPWLPVICEHPELRVGPLIVPGSGPCYRCFRMRLSQHVPSEQLTAELHRHYDEDPTAGPRGHMPFHALLAAAAARSVIESGQPGRVLQLNLVTQKSGSGQVVGVHGCPLCGGRVPEHTRGHERLARDVARVLDRAEPGA
jgi:bacteriocin biosynthesis cyclodehydratase domain-containing protein